MKSIIFISLNLREHYTSQWRQLFEKLSKLRDGQIRFFGMLPLLLGFFLLILR